MRYTDTEIDSLRLYNGDTRIRNSIGILVRREENSFWNDKEAYRRKRDAQVGQGPARQPAR